MVHTDRYQYDLAVDALDEALQGFQAFQDRIGLIEVELLRARIANQRGNFKEAAQRADHIAQLPNIPANLRGYAEHLLGLLGIAALNMGEAKQALLHLERALPLFRATGDAYNTSQLLQQMEVTFHSLGRFEEAGACLQEVVAIRRSLGSATGLAAALNNLGYHYHLLSDYDQATLAFEEGLSVASRTPEKRVESYLLWSLGDLLRDRGNYEEASHLYHKALEIIGDSEPALKCSVVTSLSTLRRWQGNLDESLALAVEATNLATAHGATLEKLKAATAMWATRAQQGEVEAAREAFDSLANNLWERQFHSQLAQIWGLCAFTSLLKRDTLAARTYLRTAAVTIANHAYLQPLIAEIMHTPLLHKYVVRNSSKFSFLNDGLKRLEAAKINPPVAQRATINKSASETYSLRVWCLGREHVERDGETVSSAQWQAIAARELFFYLLFKGASTRELISLAFWPDSPARLVRSNFHSTLHRARHAVGANTILFHDDLYFINPEISLWCDALELQSLVRQAKTLPPRTAHAENLWRRAVQLYQGELLPTTYAEWALGCRTALQETHLEALLGLANAERVREEFSEAIGTLKRALEIDPYREDIHRSIMICFAAQGERKQLLQHLEGLKRLLRRELGIAPSDETLSLATKLLHE
jgi:DNA-binding SARP family transcriptional activator